MSHRQGLWEKCNAFRTSPASLPLLLLLTKSSGREARTLRSYSAAILLLVVLCEINALLSLLGYFRFQLQEQMEAGSGMGLADW